MTEPVNPDERVVRPVLERADAQIAADWIRGHRPAGYPDDVAWGRALDRVVERLRAALAGNQEDE